MTMRTSLILEARDRASRLVDRVRRSTERLRTQGITPLGRAVERVNAVSGRFMNGLPTRLATITARARALAGRAGMGALRASAYGAGYAIGFTIRQAARLALTVSRLAAGAAIGGAGFLGGWFTQGVIGTTATFEQFQVVLENTEGSVAKARQSMDWVKTFAQRTPYQIADVMQAFVALRAYGIDPTKGALRSLGDAASGMGKPLMQAIEMLAHAQTGEFEQLKEFGIRAKKTGDQVMFTYMRNGQEIRRTARGSAAEIQRTLLGIFDERFKGMMDRQSRTLGGMWSNLMDTLSNFQLDTGQAGIFDFVKGQLGELLDWVNAKSKDGSLQRWAKDASDKMVDLARAGREFVMGIRWNEVGEGLQTAVKVASALLGLLGKIVGLVQWMHRNSSLINSSSLPFGGQLFDLARGRPPFVQAPPQPSASRRVQASPAQRRQLWTPARPLPGLSNSGRPAQTPSMARPQASKVAIDINLTGPGARNASVRGIRSEGTDLAASVYRGRAMAGAA